MRENKNQKNSKYGHFSRRYIYYVRQQCLNQTWDLKIRVQSTDKILWLGKSICLYIFISIYIYLYISIYIYIYLYLYISISFKVDSYLPKNWFYLLQWKAFENDEKWYLFHVESPLRSQERKQENGLIRNLRLISKFLTSQPRKQTINKQLQYTYCPVSQEVKATRQWNSVS